MNLNDKDEKKLRNMIRMISFTLHYDLLLVYLLDEELHVHPAELVYTELYRSDAFSGLYMPFDSLYRLP
jgi:hypothetical protein